LENHFLDNHETHALYIEATFRSFVQGDLSVNDYYWKMKGFTDSLAGLGSDVTNRILMLNVLRGLKKNFKHLCAIFTHAMPSPSFPKVLNDLCLEETQHGIQVRSATASTPTAFYATQEPLSSSSSTGRQEHLP
jgi:hypothetical protein